jgi:hypothetical protein
MKRLIVRSVLPSAAVAFLACAGCDPASMAFTGGQMGVKVFTGAQAKVHVLRDTSVEAMRAYRSVELGEVTTDVAPICTFEEISEVRLSLRGQFSEEKFIRYFPGGEPKLQVNVVLRFFKEGAIYGKEPRLDLLVTFLDAATRREVGRIYVEGISQSPLQTKTKHLAKADAQAIANLLRERKEGKRRSHQ